ncbi:MAG TPA: dienelactone hydrolase family protein [Sphingobium sp.]
MFNSPEQPASERFGRETLDLFDAYVHGAVDRRGFIQKCAVQVGSLAAASAVLTALSPDFARAQVVAPDDKRIVTHWITIPSSQGNGIIKAYVARPRAAGKKVLPVIIVAHENRGLNPHIEDITRRLALDGFQAVAPDALTTLGGYPGDEDKARDFFTKLDRAKVGEDFVAAARYALTMEGSNGKLGATGFCFGGGIANQLATRVPELRAAVPFYGAPAVLQDVPHIKAELLLHFGGNDTRTNAGWATYEEALKKAGKRYTAYIYDGAEHGFNNDTTPRFDKVAADLAWGRTIALFKRTLG